MRWLSWLVLVACVALYAGTSGAQAYEAVTSVRHGRDFATYYYATHEAVDGGDPYATRRLSRRARDDGARSGVHPYFYPPPFLVAMVWVAPLDLPTAYRMWFAINHVLLALVAVVTMAWFRVPAWVWGVLLVTFSPIPDNAKMGQANVLVLLLSCLGLWLRSGVLVGLAGMSKMAPALYLLLWAARRWWRPVGIAVATAVLSSLLALPLVGFDAQLRFYSEVLPTFATGEYHGLKIPISLPANHSIPDLLHQAFPSGSDQRLSPTAQWGARAALVGIFGALTLLAKTRRDAIGEACLAGAFTVAMVVVPVYAYEHHLVTLLLPLTALAAAALVGRLPRWTLVVLGVAYAACAVPLLWLRELERMVPDWTWWIRESKFAGVVAIGLLCVLAVRRSPASKGAAGGVRG